jgi:hypothetical protein
MYGTPCLALRSHLPTELANLELVDSLEDLENLRETFTTRDSRDPGTGLWRCDVGWIHPQQHIYSIAGACDRAMLSELRRAHLLLLIEESVWDRWEFLDAHLSICNDREMWLRWKT